VRVGAWDGAGVEGYIHPGVWTNLTTTFDGTTLSLYINGALTQSSPAQFNLQGVPFFAGDDLPVAADTGVDERHFEGEMRLIRVYNRVLNAAEVASLYQRGSKLLGL